MMNAIHTPNVVRLEAVQVAPIWNGCGEAVRVHAAIPVKQRARQTLTAVRTLADRLQLYSWRVDAGGGVYCTGTTAADLTGVLQIALVKAQKFVTACRTANYLQLQSWDVSNTGAIYGLVPAAVLEGNFSWFTLVALSLTQLVTIVLTQEGNWQLTAWQLGSDGLLTQSSTVTMQAAVIGALAALALPATPAGTEFAVVCHRTAQQLCWRHWRCTPAGELVEVACVDAPFANVVELALVRHADQLLTLMQTAQGELALLPSHLLASPSAAIELGTAHAIADGVAHFAVAGEADALLIAYSGVMHQLSPEVALDAPDRHRALVQLQRWAATGRGWQPCAAGVLPLPTATDLQLCAEPLDGYAPYLTAIGTAEGALHLTTWRALVG